jgi:hypothetical protein
MPVPSSTFDIEILPAEEFADVLVNPGAFQNIKVFSYRKVLVLELELEEEGIRECQGELSAYGHLRYF